MRKRILTMILAWAMCLGLCIPAFASDSSMPSMEDVVATIAWSYTAGDKTFDSDSAAQVDTEEFEYIRYKETNTGTLEQVKESQDYYYAVSKDSVFTVKNTGVVSNSFIIIYVTACIKNDEGVYVPEWTCRQQLTAKGFYDESMPAEIFGGVKKLQAGDSVQFELPKPVLVGLGLESQGDAIYILQLALVHQPSGIALTIPWIFKEDETAVSAKPAGQDSRPDTPSSASGSPAAPAQSASPTASTVLVNGEQTAFDAYNIGGNNYFKLRDLAYVLSGTEKQFEVGWDGAANAITLTPGAAYTSIGGEMTAKGSGTRNAVPSTSKILLDGEEISLTAYNIEGNNYFKLRDVGEVFDFGVGWDAASSTITIDTAKSYTPG